MVMWNYFTSYNMPKPYQWSRVNLIHFACIRVAPPRLFTPRAFSKPGVTSRGRATPMQAKWIKLDLTILHHAIFECFMEVKEHCDNNRGFASACRIEHHPGYCRYCFCAADAFFLTTAGVRSCWRLQWSLLAPIQAAYAIPCAINVCSFMDTGE